MLRLAGLGVAAATVLPIAHLAVRAGEADDAWSLVVSPRVLRFVWATVGLGLTVTVLSLVIGVGVAWLLDRTDIPGGRMLAVGAVLPLVVPTYVGALALLAAFGPGGLAFELRGIVGFWGATAALTLSTFPYVLLPVRSALATADPALEEAAQALGDGRRTAFRRAVLPQVRPAAAAGALLVFLYVLSDFGAVSIMRYDTLTRGIFLEYRSAFNRSSAAVLGVLLVVLTLLALAGERRARGRMVARSAASSAGRASSLTLGPWRWPAFTAVIALVSAGTGLPVAVLTYWSIRGASRADGDALVGAVGTSTGLSLGAAAAAVMIAVPVSVLVVRHRSRFSRIIETLATAGYALPGLVVALALVFFASRYLSPLYQTFMIVVVAYVVRFFPEALGAVQSSLVRIDPVLEEAGRSLGRSRLDLARTVTVPLLRGGLVAGAALVFLTAMKELPATLLLLPAGSDTLATLVWTGAADGRYAQAAPPALLVVAISALVLWPLDRVRDRRTRQ